MEATAFVPKRSILVRFLSGSCQPARDFLCFLEVDRPRLANPISNRERVDMAQRLRRVMDNQIDKLLAEQAHLGKCLRSNPSILHALLTRRRKGVVVSPKNGMFASRDLWESLDVRQRHLFVARTIADRCPDDLFCYMTAAFAYGLDFTITGDFGTDVKTVCISGKGGANGCSSAGLRRFKLEADGAWTAEGLRVSSPEKTVFDCARGLAFPDGLAIADSALRLGLLDPDSLRRLIDSGGNRKGIGKARDVSST